MQVMAINRGVGKSARKSSAILDAYLTRVSDHCWHGFISKEGTLELKDKLKECATRASSVLVYQLHNYGKELLFSVGHGENVEQEKIGKVSIARRFEVNHIPEWANQAKRIGMLAALWHDIGKMAITFQAFLANPDSASKKLKSAFPVKHQTLSAELFLAYFKNSEMTHDIRLKEIKIAPTLYAFGEQDHALNIAHHIVLSHHGLPEINEDEQSIRLNNTPSRFFLIEKNENLNTILPAIKEKYLNFSLDKLMARPGETFANNRNLLEVSKRLARGIERHPVSSQHMSLYYYLARLGMMLGDQAQSIVESEDSSIKPLNKDCLYAKSASRGGSLLLDHSMGVADFTEQAVRYIIGYRWPTIRRDALEYFPVPQGDFAWQKAAEDVIKKEYAHGDIGGFFGVMIAEVGSGKTQGGFRIMNALSKNRPRYNFALAQGRLTIQAGEEYRDVLKLSPHESMTFVGRRFQSNKEETVDTSANDDDTSANDDNVECFLEAEDDHVKNHMLPRVFEIVAGSGHATSASAKKRKALLSIPIAIMTIDHIISAIDADRGAFLLPAARTITSDLLIDEIDSFDMDGVHCLARLCYLVGMFGRRVVISSATVTKELVEVLFESYSKGYAKWSEVNGLQPNIKLGVFSNQKNLDDDFCKIISNNHIKQYSDFSAQVAAKIEQKRFQKKLGDLITVQDGLKKVEPLYDKLFQTIVNEAKLRARDKDCYFAILRFNLAQSASEMTKYLSGILEHYEDDEIEVKINCLTSRLDSQSRRKLEAKLKKLMNRKPLSNWRETEEFKNWHTEKKRVFILITNSIVEAGRDYDFDLAISEPCSDESLIQLSGRVYRHRVNEIPEYPCLYIAEQTVRKIRGDAGFYGNPGPGFDQVNPVFRDPTNKGRVRKGQFDKKPIGELFDIERYQKIGITAAGRLNTIDRTSYADRHSRNQIADMMDLRGISPGKIGLKRFLSLDNPFFYTEFKDKIKLRDEEDGACHFELTPDGKWKTLDNGSNQFMSSTYLGLHPKTFLINLSFCVGAEMDASAVSNTLKPMELDPHIGWMAKKDK